MKPVDEPAPTVALGHNQTAWCWERPATTVCADSRIFGPGYRGRPEDYGPDGEYHGKRSGDNAVRVAIWELGVLQGFPEDYPWSGTKEQQARSVGNAIPPPLAFAILKALS